MTYMNRLPIEKRAQVLHMLVEGSSMRSISRVMGVSFNTVNKLLVDGGKACDEYHNRYVRNLQSQRIQCDEIWSFTYAKNKNVPRTAAAPPYAGDTWTWTAIDADSKLVVSWLVGGRDAEYGIEFIQDLQSRLANRVQLTTMGTESILRLSMRPSALTWTMPSW